jgi:hypothetical protein
MKKLLEGLAGEAEQIEKGEHGTIRDARLLFADDIMSRFFIEASGGDEALEEVHGDIEAAISAFMRFTNAALDEWFFRSQQERGAKFFDFGERRLGWPEPDLRPWA